MADDEPDMHDEQGMPSIGLIRELRADLADGRSVLSHYSGQAGVPAGVERLITAVQRIDGVLEGIVLRLSLPPGADGAANDQLGLTPVEAQQVARAFALCDMIAATLDELQQEHPVTKSLH